MSGNQPWRASAMRLVLDDQLVHDDVKLESLVMATNAHLTLLRRDPVCERFLLSPYSLEWAGTWAEKERPDITTVKADKECALACVRWNPWQLQYLTGFQDDLEVVLAAAARDPSSLEFASREMLGDTESVLAMLNSLQPMVLANGSREWFWRCLSAPNLWFSTDLELFGVVKSRVLARLRPGGVLRFCLSCCRDIPELELTQSLLVHKSAELPLSALLRYCIRFTCGSNEQLCRLLHGALYCWEACWQCVAFFLCMSLPAVLNAHLSGTQSKAPFLRVWKVRTLYSIWAFLFVTVACSSDRETVPFLCPEPIRSRLMGSTRAWLMQRARQQVAQRIRSG